MDDAFELPASTPMPPDQRRRAIVGPDPLIVRREALAAAYDRARSRLVGIAYAIVGGFAEAEDVVSDCWLRLVEADGRSPIRDVEGWSIAAVSRAALDVLHSARRRRETYPGTWLPEPVVDVGNPDPSDRVTLDDRIRYAVLVMLESLSPAERTVWVLHEMFELPFTEVSTIVGRTPAAVRQLASRARRHVAEATPRFDVAPATEASVTARFLAAAEGGSLAELVRLLDPDVVLTSDGGGEVRTGPRPVVGADRVARFLITITSRLGADERPHVVAVNGAPGGGGVPRRAPDGRAGAHVGRRTHRSDRPRARSRQTARAVRWHPPR